VRLARCSLLVPLRFLAGARVSVPHEANAQMFFIARLQELQCRTDECCAKVWTVTADNLNSQPVPSNKRLRTRHQTLESVQC
jgi:hypothetical protein